MSTKILAIGTLAKPPSSPEVGAIMASEVPPTLKLYLDGHMDQFWVRQGNTGVGILMNVNRGRSARTARRAAPHASQAHDVRDLPIGPLGPLGMLINGGQFQTAGA